MAPLRSAWLRLASLRSAPLRSVAQVGTAQVGGDQVGAAQVGAAQVGADHLRQAIAAKGALAVIPNNPSRALKYPLDKHLYAQRHLVECCFSKLKQFRRVAKRPPEITVPSSLSPPPSYGCDKYPHHLALKGFTSAKSLPRARDALRGEPSC
jgi:transposase